MSEHKAAIRWQNPNPGPEFLKGRYSRSYIDAEAEPKGFVPDP